MSVNQAGRVAALFRYPVKSMQAEPLESIDVDWYGFAGDRRWAFVRDGVTSSGFPWLTMRQNPAMGQYRPRLVEPDKPDASITMVRTPSGAELDVTDPVLAAELADGARVIRQKRGIFDAFPLSLITTQTVSAVGSFVSLDLDVRRFRPNIVIEGMSGGFSEDEWVGAIVRAGGMTMRVDKRDKRCVMVNVDPETAEREPAVLRSIASERESCLGVYGTIVQPGRVTVGDEVSVER